MYKAFFSESQSHEIWRMQGCKTPTVSTDIPRSHFVRASIAVHKHSHNQL